MDITVSTNEQENKKKGMVVSIILHTLLLILLIIPFIGFPIPPPGQEGIIVSLGQIDTGDGDDRPDTQSEKIEKRTEEKKVEKVEDKKELKEETSTRAAAVKAPAPDVLTSAEKAEIELRKQEKAEQARQAQIEKEAREAAEAEKQREAEEARKAAEAEAAKKAAFEQSKKQYSSLLGGSGKGNKGTPGNQGVENGDPDAQALVGISTGSGMVGGGLGSRGVLFEPDVKDNSQKTGVVVMNVCVNASGNVVSADYTQRGSTTTDSDLRKIAEKSAKKFRFTPSDIEKQCGTVTIEFKVK